MFPAVGMALVSLHPITGGILWRELKFQACTNILNKFFFTVMGIFGPPSYSWNMEYFLSFLTENSIAVI
jgi:hypothetical protein